MRTRASGLIAGVTLALTAAVAAAAPTPPMKPDVPADFTVPRTDFDYVKREVMIPMRDGVKLYTVIVIPKGARRAPIVLTRTPYDASMHISESSPHMLAILSAADAVFVNRGYIRVFQDVRGKYGSEGDYVMTRELRGPLNDTAVDHSTDAWDTIDWLVKNLPESNGRVGMIGSSYEGFTVLMGLINPHPALKAAVPECPMVDGWKGDDWFHNGAWRQFNFDYIYRQTTRRGKGEEIPRGAYDDYQLFLGLGSAGAFGARFGFDNLPFFQKLSEHPAYDEFWSGQALDQILAKQSLKVPTLFIASLWDQEDIYGGVHAYAALKAQDRDNRLVYLVLGPWRHSGINAVGTSIGPLSFDGDTAAQVRQEVIEPFLAEHLKDAATRAGTPPVLVFETGTNAWRHLPTWPLSCESGCPQRSQPLYLQPHFGLSFTAPPVKSGLPFDEYVSDPAKPVPNTPRPVHLADRDAWRRWLVVDQRFVADRPDVLSYTSQVLTEPVHIAGAPMVNLYAATSGTDSDWVVKLIDVYPDEVAADPPLGGYQLSVAMDIFRGRYRESLAHPSPIPAGQTELYRFALPDVNHVFLPGHRIMVQVQSSWFPLYDRNPQTYVENIFFARPEDYKKATQQVFHIGGAASFIDLPVVEAH
jgi:uncharacterized protein